jgi:LCP family protein required for cell wall assembly
MQQPYEPFGSEPEHPPERHGGFSPRSALLTFAFATFVLGGFSFGWLFLSNYKLLFSFEMARVQGPGGSSINVPIPSAPGVVPRPPGRGQVPQVVVVPGEPTPTPEPQVSLDDVFRGVADVSAKRRNILLLGIDHRPDEPIDGSRSDTVMVVSIDPPSKSVVMISFPRDLWVNIPGYYPQRLNVAHAVGGPQLVARTIQANFGIQIDNYARVDFNGFEQVVDAVGGVIIDVERPIKDDEYPTEDYGTIRLYIPPGPILLDGKTALMYARSRHSEDDFGRSKRQQRVLLALRDRGLQLDILPRIPSLIGIAKEAVSTDLGPLEMMSLAKLGADIQRDRIKTLVLDGNYADPFIGQNGENLLAPRQRDITAAILRAYNEAAGQTAPVEILNGTNQAGVASRLADALARAGYDVRRVADADRNDYADTTIEVLGNNEQAASVLAARLKLPASAIKLVPTPNAGADLRVIVGNSYKP